MSSPPRVLLALPRYRGQNHALFLGVACLAKTLKMAGAEVAVLDEDVAARAEAAGDDSVDEIIERVLHSFRPTIIGVHINTPNYAAALAMSSRLRSRSDMPMVAGGPHASIAAVCLLGRHREFDFVLRGEADRCLPALAWAVQGRGRLVDVPGLSHAPRGHIEHQPQGALIPGCELPAPDREALLRPPDPALERHARALYAHNFSNAMPGFGGREVAGGYASRGCYARCRFCSPARFWSDPRTGRPIRRLRPVAAVLEEMSVIGDLGYGAVFFDEPTFPLASEPEWVRAFCDGMRELNLLWGAPTRLDELEPQDLPLLVRGGMRYVYFGLETPIPQLQQRLQKPSSASRVHALLAACEDSGLQCDVSLFFGSPGETDETIDRTLEWMAEHLPRGNAFFSLAAYWPGTQWALQAGLVPECWEPDFDRGEALRMGAVWYPESATSIDRFFSNSTGTYHPAFLTIERALAIKERILTSGFRKRFSSQSRRVGSTPSQGTQP